MIEYDIFLFTEVYYMDKNLKSDKLYSVEFMRFIFAVVIVYFHIIHV